MSLHLPRSPTDQSTAGTENAIKVLEALQPQLKDAASNWRISFAAYFLILLLFFLLQAFSVLGLLIWSYVSCKRRMRARCFAPITYPVSAVVPCYLPNEADIIQGTLQHMLTKLTHIEHLDVFVVYNTPYDMDLEKELAAMAAGPMPAGRRLFVERVHGSCSKAANLNYIIPKITTKCVSIYDADHHPEPRSLAMSVDFLVRHNLDCVQGSTFIRQGSCLFRTLINGEFFVTYFVMLPVLQNMSGTAFFGGANGLWRTSSLQKLHFDTEMMTEDIDCFARAYETHGFSFKFLPESRSGEMAPLNWQGLWKQRMRWAVGWDQVTVRYAPGFFRANMPRRRKFALYYIFCLRYLSLFSGATVVIYGAWGSFDSMIHPDKLSTDQPAEILVFQKAVNYIYFIIVIFAMLQIWLQEPTLSTFVSVSLYFCMLPLWVIIHVVLTIISLIRIASGNVGSWVVTNRLHNNTTARRDSHKKEYGNAAIMLAVLFALQGLIILCVFAYGYCQRQAGHLLIAWTSFGILSPTSASAVDGRVAVQGFSSTKVF